MVVKRVKASVWAILLFGGLVEVTACEGESTTEERENHGGESGTNTGGATDGCTGARGGNGATSGQGGGATGGTGARGGSPGGGTGGDVGGEAGNGIQGGVGGDAGDDGGAGDSGAGADAGAGGSGTDDTVRGRVVDFWLAPLPNVPVTIGTTTVATNANGDFAVPDVAPQYDVSMVVRWTGTQAGVYGWRYEGLTRRDPTLQVYRGRTVRYANILISPQNAMIDASRNLSVVIAGPHGASQWGGVGASGLQSSAGWVGPVTMPATAHALLWTFDSNDLPAAYHSYDGVAGTLDDSSSAQVVFSPNLGDETITSGTVSGLVTSPMSSDRANQVFVRFAYGGSIEIVNDYPPPTNYSYLVPELPGTALVTFAASYGFGSTEYAVAHRTVVAGQQNVNFSIPAVAVPSVPAVGVTDVNGTTEFAWTDTATAFVFHLEDVDYYQGLFVVTSRKRITLPSFEGFDLRPGGSHTWQVETHGGLGSVDAYAGPQGGLDSMSLDLDSPHGPKTGSGSHARSLRRSFTMAD